MPTKREGGEKIYQEVLSLLSGNQLKVASILAQYEDLTGRELDELLGSTSSHKRISELRKMEVIYSRGPRLCTVSGKKSVAWALTGKTPTTPPDEIGLRPTRTEIQNCLPILRRLYLDMMSSKDIGARDIKRLGQWLASLVAVEPIIAPPPPPAPKQDHEEPKP